MTSYCHFYVNNDVVMTSLCHNEVIDDVIIWVVTRPSATHGRSLFFKVKESKLLRVQSVVRIKYSVVRIKCRHRHTRRQNVAQFPHPPSPTGIGWNKVDLHNHLDSQLLTPTGIRICCRKRWGMCSSTLLNQHSTCSRQVLAFFAGARQSEGRIKYKF